MSKYFIQPNYSNREFLLSRSAGIFGLVKCVYPEETFLELIGLQKVVNWIKFKVISEGFTTPFMNFNRVLFMRFRLEWFQAKIWRNEGKSWLDLSKSRKLQNFEEWKIYLNQINKDNKENALTSNFHKTDLLDLQPKKNERLLLFKLTLLC